MLTLHGRALSDGQELPLWRFEIENGRFAGVNAQTDPSPGDLAAAYLSHGLIDLQVNGAGGIDLTSTDDPENAVVEVARVLARHGVTAFCPTIVSSAPDVILERLHALRPRAIPGGARSLGAHVEGPFISPRHPGVHDPTVIRPPSPAEIARWVEIGPPAIVTLAPELPGALDAIRQLRAAGVVVSLGHSGADVAQTRSGLEAGASMGTHLFNAMPPMHHRAPGLVAGLLTSNATVGILADGVHVDGAAVEMAVRAAGPGRIALVSDAMAAAGAPPGDFRLGDQTVTSDGVAVRRADGTLAGSAAMLDLGLRNARRWCSWLARPDVIRMATSTPAAALGLRARIEGDGVADVVLLDGDWNVEATVIAGEVVHRR